jgi:hypothetical protein
VKQAAGQSFGSLVRAEACAIYDKVVYLDTERGLDGNTGDDWSSPVKTINGAIDKWFGGDNDTAKGRHLAIVLRGRTTTGLAQTSMQTIDVEGVHLIGAGAWYGHGGGGDSCLVCGSSTAYASKCAIKVTRSNCSIEGIKFYMPSEYALGSEEYHIYATNPTDFAVTNCQFIGANSNGDMTGKYGGGILIEGSEGAYLANNEFLYCYRGIKGMAGSSRYFHKSKIYGNAMFGNDIGIYFGDTYELENDVGWNSILRPSPSGTAYGYTMTGGIVLNGCSGNYFHDNRVGHATKATAYTKGAGTNYWSLNYYDAGSGGTLYDGG